MTFTWSVSSASLLSVSESFASLACTRLPASISSPFSLARSSAKAAKSWAMPCSLAWFDCSCCSVSLSRCLASSRERSSSASASHGNAQTRPTSSSADRSLCLEEANRSDCAIRLAVQPMATTTECTAESRQNAYESLTFGTSGAVVGVAGKDRLRAIDLLGQNDAGEPMGQGHGPRTRPVGLDRAARPRPSAPPIRKRALPRRRRETSPGPAQIPRCRAGRRNGRDR